MCPPVAYTALLCPVLAYQRPVCGPLAQLRQRATGSEVAKVGIPGVYQPLACLLWLSCSFLQSSIVAALAVLCSQAARLYILLRAVDQFQHNFNHLPGSFEG